MSRCIGRYRHWRIARGTVGLRTPVCIICGSPNPSPLSEEEWADLVDWSRDHNVGGHVRSAIEARDAAEGEAGDE